jgi:20S proteasome alpha/beta subunit
MQNNGPKQSTQQPIVTGTSVIAIKYKDGVVMAADNLGMHSCHLPTRPFFTCALAISTALR